MKLLFVENQYKTFFFEAIALKLQEQGHDIFWIVQNKKFAPKSKFNTHIIPYPKKNSKTYTPDKSIDYIIESDRNMNYFEYKDKSHFYYYSEVLKKLVHEIHPDFIFGECTLFHELLIAKHCKELGIKYLNPLPCRYPTNKFTFYLYHTMESYGGCNKDLPREKAIEIMDNINGRVIAPDYMKPLVKTKFEKLQDKLYKTRGYYLGEKYNTPSPFVKLKIEKTKNQNKQKWDVLAQEGVDKTDGFKVLYPLQVQPEENIDVWGRPRRNQLKVIQEIVENLPEDALLYVKPNPKPRYEVDGDMIHFVSNHKKIKMISHSTSMTEVFSDFDLIITVTGTVAIESILANKPVVTLIKTLNNTVKNCIYLEKLDNLEEIILNVKNDSFPKATLDEKIGLINLLNRTSYEGNVSDVFNDPNCLDEDNINLIVSAFNEIIEK